MQAGMINNQFTSSNCCHHHINESAANQCEVCGNNICNGCVDSYTITLVDNSNVSLCFDCYQEYIQENIDLVSKNRALIKRKFMIQVIGFIVGAIIGAIVVYSVFYSNGYGMYPLETSKAVEIVILCAIIGSSFVTYFKESIKMSIKAINAGFESGSWIGFFISLLISSFLFLFKLFKISVLGTIKYAKYYRETSTFEQQDIQGLQQIRDYMFYTLVVDRNKDTRIEDLVKNGGPLSNNFYAQFVLSNGNAAAYQAIHNVESMLDYHGKIIRDIEFVD